MSSFDTALDSIKMPTSDDLEITLPPRREPKPAGEPAAEPSLRDLGQHGGATEAHNDTTPSGAADAAPLPQRDEPDEGEHTDSTQEQIESRARRSAAAARDVADVDGEEGSSADEPGDPKAETDAEDQIPSPASEEPLTLEEILASTAGRTPRGRVRGAFSPGAKTSTLTLKRFPQPLVDKLRILIAPKLGGEFAETISAPALITAFMVAQLGVELDLDASTAAAAEAFRDEDQRITVLEDKVNLLLGNVDQLGHATHLGLKRLSEMGAAVDSTDFAVSYLLTDRVAGLSTTDVNENNVDVTQRKVLAARSTVRAASRAQRTIEQHEQNRSNR